MSADPSPGKAALSSEAARASPAYCGVVIGCSAGGPEALKIVLRDLPRDYGLPVLVVQHLHPSDEGRFAQHLDQSILLEAREVMDKTTILPGCVHVAPANYHLLIEADGRFALDTGEKVNYSRPSIDVTFESAALAWSGRLVCILLSGASHDGAAGALLAKGRGATVLVQDPAQAEAPVMPQAAIDAGAASHVLPLVGIAEFLLKAHSHNIINETK